MQKKFEDKMKSEGLSPQIIETFKFYYQKLSNGNKVYIQSSEALPVNDLPKLDSLDKYEQTGRESLDKAIILNLNGGLGTSMGMRGPKSLVKVVNQMSFLEVIVRQVLSVRKKYNTKLPLLLMNSFNTHTQTIEALKSLPDIEQDIPVSFIENKFPKVNAETMGPVDWPENRRLEWAPPGHGDVYDALYHSGTLQDLLDKGYEYAFVSNTDNLGAVMDTRLLGYMAAENIPFLMEVTDRTIADQKGGHIAKDKEGNLFLREAAQCPPDEIDEFQDIEKYAYFNTNNIWVHLPSVKEMMDKNDGKMILPLMRNEKTVDPTNPDSPKVYQLETAMGTAIQVFKGAQAINVPRNRFIPVKKTTDLIPLWSDVYKLDDEFRLVLDMADPLNKGPIVNLDTNYYKFISDLKLRFPNGSPSLRQCPEFTITGDVLFGRDIVAKGPVSIENTGESQVAIPDGTLLEGNIKLPF